MNVPLQRIIAICLVWIAVPLTGGEPTPREAANGTPADVRDLTNSDYLIEMASVNIKFGALDRAEPLLRRALDKSKTTSQKELAHQTLAALLERKGDLKGSVEQYVAAFSLANTPPDRARLGLLLADEYVRLNDTQEAEKLLSDIADRNIQSEHQWMQDEIFRMQVRIWQTQPGRIDAYITDAESKLKRNGDEAATLGHLSTIYSDIKHDPAKAAQTSERLASLRPDDKNLRFKLADLFKQSRQFDKAADVYRKLATIPGAHNDETRFQSYQLATLMGQAGKKDDAIAWMKESFAKGASTAQDYSLLVTFYEQIGSPTEVDAGLSKMTDIATSPEEKAGAQIQTAEIAYRRQDYQKADDLAKAILTDFNDNPAVCSRANAILKRTVAKQSKPSAEERPATSAAAKASGEPKGETNDTAAPAAQK